MTPPHPPRRDGKTPRHRRSRGISTAAYGARSCSAAANELGRAHILDALTHRTDPDGTLALKDLIASAQQQLGDHPAFPNGRLRNYCTFTKVDREARNLVERVPRNSPSTSPTRTDPHRGTNRERCLNRSFVERRAVLAASDVRLRGAARRGMCRTRR